MPAIEYINIWDANWASRLLSAGMLTFCRQHPASHRATKGVAAVLDEGPGFNKNLEVFQKKHFESLTGRCFQPNPGKTTVSTGGHLSFLLGQGQGSGTQKLDQTYPKKCQQCCPCKLPNSRFWGMNFWGICKIPQKHIPKYPPKKNKI